MPIRPLGPPPTSEEKHSRDAEKHKMAVLADGQVPGRAAAIRPPPPLRCALCRSLKGPAAAVGERPVRWRRSRPRMQSTHRPLPSALPVAKVKGSGSSRRLRPLRLHLPCVWPGFLYRVAGPLRPQPPSPPGQQVARTNARPARNLGGPDSAERLRSGLRLDRPGGSPRPFQGATCEPTPT